MSDVFTIHMKVQGMDKVLIKQYEDEQSCDTALNQLKTASGVLDFGGWQVKADHVIAFRKQVVKGSTA